MDPNELQPLVNLEDAGLVCSFGIDPASDGHDENLPGLEDLHDREFYTDHPGAESL